MASVLVNARVRRVHAARRIRGVAWLPSIATRSPTPIAFGADRPFFPPRGQRLAAVFLALVGHGPDGAVVLMTRPREPKPPGQKRTWKIGRRCRTVAVRRPPA